MKWLEEHQIADIVEQMQRRELERTGGAGGVLVVDVSPQGLRASLDGRPVTTPDPLRLRGVARPIDAADSLLIVFNRRPTDDELRAIHERLS